MKHQRPSQFHEDAPIPPTFQAPMAAFGRGASVFSRSFATLQKEGLRFLNQRLENNVKAAEDFSSCKSLPDLFAVQQKWFADATRAYVEEWQRCSELMSEAMHDATDEPVQKRPRPEEPH